MRRIALIALVVLAGCGQTASEPLPDVRPVAPTPQQSAALTRVVTDFTRGFRSRDGEAVCALLTPVAQSYLAGTRGTGCADVVIGHERVPAKTRAVTVSTDGTGATIVFADCRRWRLVLQGDAWLIDDLPLSRPRCEATDRPTA
ncbi:LptM family lipoprotein [Solirubrobacter soli]|uniref:LptM family lipoprotein n=1 Tax=Solirubrobacter soli TaxID=363832 RepID=UPI000413F104|nr:hypothetical protein [Solirubrobacter soli]